MGRKEGVYGALFLTLPQPRNQQLVILPLRPRPAAGPRRARKPPQPFTPLILNIYITKQFPPIVVCRSLVPWASAHSGPTGGVTWASWRSDPIPTEV